MNKQLLIVFCLILSGCIKPDSSISMTQNDFVSFTLSDIKINLNISDFPNWGNDQIVNATMEKSGTDFQKQIVRVNLQNINPWKNTEWVSYTLYAPGLINNDSQQDSLEVKNYVTRNLLLIDIDILERQKLSGDSGLTRSDTKRHAAMGLVATANRKAYALDGICGGQYPEHIITTPEFFVASCLVSAKTYDLWRLDENGPKRILMGVAFVENVVRLQNKRTVALVNVPNQNEAYLLACDLGQEEKFASNETCSDAIKTEGYSIISIYDPYSQKVIVQKNEDLGILSLECLEQAQKTCDINHLPKIIGPQNLTVSSLQIVNGGADILVPSFPWTKMRHAALSLFNISNGTWKYIWQADGDSLSSNTPELGDPTKILGLSSSQPYDVLYTSLVMDVKSLPDRPVWRLFVLSFSLKTNRWTWLGEINSDTITSIPFFLRAQ